MSWITLPLELKYAVVEELDDARALSQVNRLTYAACLRSLYKVRTARQTTHQRTEFIFRSLSSSRRQVYTPYWAMYPRPT